MTRAGHGFAVTARRRALPLRLRFVAAAAAMLTVAAPAAADLHQRQHEVQSRLSGVQGRIAAAHRREATLQAEIASVTQRMRSLEAKVGDVTTRLGALQTDLALHQRRMHKVDQLYRLQTDQLAFLRRQSRIAARRLDDRLVSIYESGDGPSTFEVILGARNLSQAIDRLNYAATIATRDRQISNDVTRARTSLTAARRRTAAIRTSLASETRVVAYRVQQVASVKQALEAAHGQLSGARAARRQALAATHKSEREWVAEANSLRTQSAELQAQIAAAQAAPPPSPGPEPSGSAPQPPPTQAPSGELAWPVNGPITSPFGMRWGSLHPGIDIGVPMGTPIHAAAAGRVIVASYDGGYGNLVVLDNGGGIATAYAHQSQIAVTVGQEVSQGQVIGYVGSTGFSTGPHLHFEVRVNGSPVDPMGYL